MKVLWIVNTIFPYPAKQLNMNQTVFGGWLIGLASKLKEIQDIDLAIATVYNGKEIKEYKYDNITYYLIPGAPALKYDRKMEKYWKIVNQKFKPDLVHIHGTEYAHGLSFLNACNNVKSVASIQGLTSIYANVYYGNMMIKDMLKSITIRDILKKDTLFQAKGKFYRRGKIEKEIIQRVNNIIGRTTWDYANCKAINSSIKYYEGQETLRKSFYDVDWTINEVERYTLFCSQASYPIKGIHFAIEAVKILKNKYPNVKLYIAGVDITNQKFKLSGYGKYIKKIIKKYQLQDNIIFTGLLDETQMKDILLKTHVFILPSAIENSSNSLGEAMLLGMPCVASNTGGTMDMLEHKREGFLYPYTEPAMLAEYISRYFESDNLCLEYGKKAKERANKRHNPIENVKQLLKIYEDIVKEGK